MLNIAESLKKQREQILNDGSGEMPARHTGLLDIAVITLYNRLVNRPDLDVERFRATGAVAAMGLFGRGLLGPLDAIPLLFLRADGTRIRESRFDEIVFPLQEAGWEIEPLESEVSELLERAAKDTSLFLQLLDIRYISGNRQLAEQLDRGLDALIGERREEILAWLAAETRGRETVEADAWLEPDLRKNPGALDDITVIRAACRVAVGAKSLEDALFRGYLERREVDVLRRAETTHARLLARLRSVEGGSRSVVFFDEQTALAEKLGYTGRAGFLPVEVFMQELFRTFHEVGVVSREFWDRLAESRNAGGEATVSGAELEPGIHIRAGRMHLQRDHYPATAGALVHLFVLSAKHGIAFDNATHEWIRHHQNTLDTASGDPRVRDELLELLRSDSPDILVVRRFYDMGLLHSLIPELVAVHGLVQHDAFHLYPVHEHHLRTLSVLKGLMAGTFADAEPEVSSVASGQGDPGVLFLAGLLHDMGKSSGRGHAQRGGEMIPAVVKRLALDPEDGDLLRFLVSRHLLLTDSASLRDLADMEMLLQCAEMVGSVERLESLLLLTFSDMAATGPKALRKWNETPVPALCDRVRQILDRGEPGGKTISERIEHVREQVGRAVADLMGEKDVAAYVAQLAPRYLLSMSSAAIARHLRMGLELERSGKPFVWEVAPGRGTAELVLMSVEMPGLLAKAAGVLTLHDLDIAGARIFTMENGLKLHIFRVRFEESGGRNEPDWESVKKDMVRLTQGRLALDYRIAAHAESDAPVRVPSRIMPSRILIDNESSAAYSILEVYAVDRVGLLYTISRTLSELQINIYVAKITTKIDQVADVFYIRNHEGQKVTDPEQIEEIKCALCFWLDGSRQGMPAGCGIEVKG